ncbi:MAG: methionyl-tRNA formyltransferase [Chloroflexota bacterium]|nr:methionyl-tRNA formyltransferase [Chloroflexota bacterium]
MGRIGRVAFLGTGSFAVPLLRRLPELADELLVISTPERPAGRGLESRPSPVAKEARSLGLRLATPQRLRSEGGRAAIAEFAPDGLLLAAYGQIVPADLLKAAPRPPLNIHPSLLPHHRGAAPVAAAILAGDEITGVSLMIMVLELDAGPIVAQWPVTLTGREQAPELEARLAALAAERVPEQLDAWATGSLEARPQDATQATVVHPFTRNDGLIDWARSAEEIDRQVRALQPWPGAWTTLGKRRLHVRRAHPQAEVVALSPGTVLLDAPTRVASGRGVLVLDEVQPEGRALMPADAWRRGVPGSIDRLGS